MPSSPRREWPERRDGPVDYDAELQRFTAALRRVYGIGPGDHVLDIGCGAGQTTREAGRLAAEGEAVGVDISATMLERARRLTGAAGLTNVHFELGDAQTHPFPSEHYDVAISRFGTMFFADPAAAFANIARAMRPGGRLTMLVWREHDLNEWSVSIERALGVDAEILTPPPKTLDPFSLADPTSTERILEAAGFVNASFTDVDEPVYYGSDVSAALEWVRGFASVAGALQRLDPPSRERALDRMRDALAAHAGRNGVWLDGRAWIVVAERR